MKITNIHCHPVWGGHRNFLFVRVETDSGITGLGESGLTGRELAVQGAVAHFRPLLIGLDPMRTEHIWQTLSRGGFFPHGKILGSAMAAIDIALWDIKGKAFGVPVYDLLGGRVRDKVVCYPHCGGADLLASAQAHVDAGWKFLRWGLPIQGNKINPTESVRTAIRQFAAIRERFGDEIELCFDVHTRLDPSDAVYLCNAVEQYRPFFIEDPLRSESPQAFHQFRQRVNVPLAAGEQFSSKWDFRELIDHDLIDYARIDLCICAGITEALKIAGWCEGHYIDTAVHNPLGPVSTAACLHFNLAVSNMAVQEQPRRPEEMMSEIVHSALVWEDGYMLAPDAPGLGVELDLDAAAASPFRQRELTTLHREDGSFSNW